VSSWEITSDLDAIDGVAEKIVSSLGGERFCLWMKGTLGAGKTTLTGRILKKIGLDERIPVTSPTYTYMNDYKISDKLYAHLDLYRAASGFSPEEIGLTDVNDYFGYFVEWPEQIPDNPFLVATHTLEIEFEGDEKRKYTLKKGAQ
jgi:tRNA threonylcarbamoyladenosine biosynthesis protein TsaE